MTDIYLDNNATTKVDHAVVDVMIRYFLEQYGNPSSLHTFAEMRRLHASSLKTGAHLELSSY